MTVTALVLFAAFLHAAWNALLHSHADRLLSMTWMSVAMAGAATVVLPFVTMPAAAAWPCIVGSGVVHLVYNVGLVRAYRQGNLAQAYPIARGSSPLLVTIGAALFAHETIGPLHALGIVLVSGGIIALALVGRRVSPAGAWAAIATGALIALYSVIDGIGVRASGGQALAYAAWMFLWFWGMPVLFVLRRGAAALTASLRDSPRTVGLSLGGGLVSVAAYGIVIWAMQSGALGAVSALRETSVVFAALIGRVVLREAVSPQRWLACVIVAVGAICLA